MIESKRENDPMGSKRRTILMGGVVDDDKVVGVE